MRTTSQAATVTHARSACVVTSMRATVASQRASGLAFQINDDSFQRCSRWRGSSELTLQLTVFILFLAIFLLNQLRNGNLKARSRARPSSSFLAVVVRSNVRPRRASILSSISGKNDLLFHAHAVVTTTIRTWHSGREVHLAEQEVDSRRSRNSLHTLTAQSR